MADFGTSASYLFKPYDLATCSPNALIQEKGNWSSAITGGSSDRADGFIIRPAWLGSTSSMRSFLVDVGIGASKAILLSNLLVTASHKGFGGFNADSDCSQEVFFPVSVPAGESLYVRVQSSWPNLNAHVLEFALAKLRSGAPCAGHVIDTYGADTINVRGTNCQQQPGVSYGWNSTYYELTPSCKRVKAFVLALGHGGEDWSTYPNQRYSIRIGIGALGSEVELLTIYEAGGSSNQTLGPSQLFLGPYYVDIAPGSRIVAKVSKEHTTYQKTLSLVMYGIR